jgi:hypothetical protein
MYTTVTFIRNYWLALLWALCILFATLASTGTLTSLHLEDLFGYDKPIHAFLFGTQAWLIVKGRMKTSYRKWMRVVLYACLISLLYGIVTEILQGIIVLLGRSFDYFDMLGDAFGCVIVYGWFWMKRKQFAQ